MQYGSSRESRKNMLPNTIQDDVGCVSILHNAVVTGDDKKLQILLGGKVDRTTKEQKHGNTPLHEAAMRGYSRCIHALCVSPHAKVDQKKKKNKIVKNESKGSAYRLILNIQNNDGFTALHLAAQNGHNQSCRELLLAGADADVQNNYGDTALHTACRYGHAGATRILLSAFCNPNKPNLNGDTALHISCAMGKRKLTRILFEADCDMELRNAQDERPLDIAIRKKHSQILEILNNSHRMYNRRDKHNRSASGHKGIAAGCVNGINWSPYGCHYFPDPRVIPSARFETFPKEPLKPGEQYYLDLGGRIRKGPIGVGNTCYCGPFLRHIEDKLNMNEINLPKLIRRAKKNMAHRVHKLPGPTSRQADQLTREFTRVERDFDKNLKNVVSLDLTRSASRSKAKSEVHDFNSTLTRCRSLELLSTASQVMSRLRNSHSCGLLQKSFTTSQIGPMSDGWEEDSAAASTNTPKSVAADITKSRSWHQLEIDYYNLMESLAKRTKRLPMRNIATEQGNAHSYLYAQNTNGYEGHANVNELIKDVNAIKVHENEPNPDKNLLACLELTFGKRSRNALTSACNESESFARITTEKSSSSTDILAIRNLDLNQSKNSYEAQHAKNSNYQKVHDMHTKSGYYTEIASNDSFRVPAPTEISSFTTTGQLHQNRKDDSLEFGVTRAEVAESEYQKSFNLKRRPFCGQSLDLFQNNAKMENGVSGIMEKVEIRNSEIKLLKKPKCADVWNNSKVRDLIAHMEEKANLANPVHQQEKAPPKILVDSESSEDELNCQSIDHGDSLQQARLHAPKDAYFHELPHKKRIYGINDREHEVTFRHKSTENSLESPAVTRSYVINNAVVHPSDRLQSTSVPHPVRALLSPTISHSDASFISSDYELYNQQNYRLFQQQPQQPQARYPADGRKTEQTAHMLQECQLHLVERDFSNDSGYCTQPYGRFHLLDSNNSAHTDYALRNFTPPTNLNFPINHAARPRPDINRSALLPYNQFSSKESTESVDCDTGYVSHLV